MRLWKQNIFAVNGGGWNLSYTKKLFLITVDQSMIVKERIGHLGS